MLNKSFNPPLTPPRRGRHQHYQLIAIACFVLSTNSDRLFL
ncbi:hypothetical protein [Okeania sp. SIO1I7]|nr:hypothetical protein [Okeania sp. SIO1I7]